MSELQSLLESGESLSFFQFLGALALAYAGGILASLTPCVYPMIPITVSVVGGMGSTSETKKSWHEVWVRALAYVSGMTVIYSFLGVTTGLASEVFGKLTNTPGWYLGLGLVFAFSALAMMDVIPFDPAVWWETFKRRLRGGRVAPQTLERKKEMTLLGAFALGASSGFIAAPCTTPMLTAIIAFIAKSRSVGLGLGLMTAFSLGLSTLLLAIAGFAGTVRFLPRSGGWMQKIKIGSGLILLAFSGYLIYRSGQLGGI